MMTERLLILLDPQDLFDLAVGLLSRECVCEM